MGDTLIYTIFRIKVIFTLLAIILVGGVISGSLWIRDNPYITVEYVKKNLAYLKYRLVFVKTQRFTSGLLYALGQPVSFQVKESPEKAKAIPVLLYHGILESSDGSNVSLKRFEEHMFTLKKAGYQTISLEEFHQFIQGATTLPDKSFLLTFDDGRRDSYYPVDPILKALDWRAVMFVITRFSVLESGDVFYLSPKEISQMLRTGRWEISSHSRDAHVFYRIDPQGAKGLFLPNKLWLAHKQRLETDQEYANRIYADLVNARNDLIQHFKINTIGFAFPYGDFGQGSKNFPAASQHLLPLVQKVYPMAFYQLWPTSGFTYNYPARDTFMIKRFDIKEETDGRQLLAILESGKPKTLPYYDNFSFNNGWFRTWGTFSLAKNAMVTQSGPQKRGSSVFLDGSLLWEQYTFSANVTWPKGAGISLVGHYQDDKNFVSCEFSTRRNGIVSVEQVIQGAKSELLSGIEGILLQRQGMELGMNITKKDVQCLVNDKVVASAHLPASSLPYGGIGFRTWDDGLDNTQLIVTQIAVTPR